MSFTRPSLLFLSMRWMTSSSSFLPSRLRMALSASGPGADKDIDKRGGFWYSTKVPCANDTRWCGAMAAQLICNQWVAGSTPVTSSKKVLRYTAEKRRVSWGFCFYVSDCIAAIQKNHAARRGAGVEIGSSRRRCGVWWCNKKQASSEKIPGTLLYNWQTVLCTTSQSASQTAPLVGEPLAKRRSFTKCQGLPSVGEVASRSDDGEV